MRQDSRRQPQQARAKLTLESIFTATARLLVSSGTATLNVKQVARLAGVSVGSLYQYLPGKDALIAALIDEYMARVRRAFTETFHRVRRQPLRDSVPQLVEAVVAVFRGEPRLLAVLEEELFRVGKMADLRELRNELAAMSRVLVQEHRQEVRRSNVDLAVFLVVHVVDAAIRSGLAERSEYLDASEFQRELADLIVNYLCHSAGAPVCESVALPVSTQGASPAYRARGPN